MKKECAIEKRVRYEDKSHEASDKTFPRDLKKRLKSKEERQNEQDVLLVKLNLYTKRFQELREEVRDNMLIKFQQEVTKSQLLAQ